MLAKDAKISLCLANVGGGGAERVSANLARGFADRGYAVEMVLFQATGVNLALLPPAVRVVDLHVRNAIRGILPLRRYLRAARPTFLISALDHVNISALCARRLTRVKTRVIATVHSTHSQIPLLPHDRKYFLMRWAMKMTYPSADAIVCVSKCVAHDLQEVFHFPREKVRYLYNPVMTRDILEKAEETVNHPWLGDMSRPLILGIGNLRPEKDYVTLIKAFALLRQKCNCRLLILGEGAERSALEQLIHRLKLTQDVQMPGFAENPYAYLKRCSLFVLSSAREALPTVLIEALGLGVPVVSTDCLCGPREILQGGKYGRMVPVNDPPALAEAMEATLQQPHRPAGREAVRPFTMDSAVNAYLEMMEELLARENHCDLQ
jgi:glycosyltransferase involved in cell wall biosynthesis